MTETTPALVLDRSSEEARAFVQQRVAAYLRFYAGLGVMFLALRVLGQVFGGDRGERLNEFLLPDFWAHAAGVLVSGTGWLVSRGRPLRRDTLETMETVIIVAAMLAYVTMGLLAPFPANGSMTSYLAVTMGLFARAIYVPSTPRRSLLIGVSIAVPGLLMNHWRLTHAPEDVMAALMEWLGAPSRHTLIALNSMFLAGWWLGTIALSTLASQVIYGLRMEVRDARRLGPYHIEEKLGEGGMGLVYRASHALLQRPSAVKLLPVDRLGEASIARFEREVQLTAQLTHPNTVTVFDYGRTPEGVFYYAMELLDGATLAKVVELTGPMPAARAAYVLQHAADALAEAHAIGLIHRDVKPANIMLCEKGGIFDTVKVVDFGLVKRITAPAGDVGLTQGNVITGTPQYMPPEALTDPDHVDAKSDIYGLGAVAFFLLTGEHLFDGKTVIEICGHHLHTPPRRPSSLVDVPAELDELIVACLEKRPEARPASASAVVERLESIAMAEPWSRAHARAWWEEHGEALGFRGRAARAEGPERTLEGTDA